MISISRPIFLGGTTAFYGFADTKVKGYFKVALSVSKDSFKPLSIHIPLMAKLQRKPWI